ncbi:WxL domain-containing protein [Lapidilactobacillus wuchangensis]|uniref:WxL domain-containing protein n=1 Tax=Lapidilactobacillus wuchangensis TaxID=2486001 RepID=UPI000F7A985C|nr:WxL domain-containing protein [Lapidilactobacillus wuchangensis]
MNYWQKTSKLIVALVLLGAIVGQITPNLTAGSAVTTTAKQKLTGADSKLVAINQAVNQNEATTTNETPNETGNAETAAADNHDDEESVNAEETTTSDEATSESEETTSDQEELPTNRSEDELNLEDEPAAPTSADGVKSASKGASLIFDSIVVRDGFITQPQSEQYVVKGTAANLKHQVINSILAGTVGSQPTMYENMWSYDEATQKWIMTKDRKIDKNNVNQIHSLGSRYDVTVQNTLDVGYYYFQYYYSKGWLQGNYYSKLVKVVVVPEEIPATDLSITPESNVVFPNFEYEAQATVTPNTSTNFIGWNKSSDVDYDMYTGREVDFEPQASVIDSAINTSTENPGIPVTLSADAQDLTGTPTGVSAATTVYVGGLKAKSLAIDQAQKYGMSWSVDGLDKLTKEFYESDTDGEALDQPKSATYSWRYYRKDSSGKYVATSFNTSQTDNSDGMLNTPAELNSTKQLYLHGDSDFFLGANVATAVNDNFYAQLTMAFKFSKETITVKTNFAQISITGAIGELSLASVPDFNFGNVAAKQIYDGNLSNESSQPVSKNNTNNQISISDTRPNQDGKPQTWYLSAEMSSFEDQDEQTLPGTNLKLTGLPNSLTPVLPSDSEEHQILSSNEMASGNYPVAAQLQLAANPLAKLTEGVQFHSTITWNLTSDTPTAAAL